MGKKIDEYRWQDIPIGCVVTEPGSSREYLTGGWATLRPVMHKEQCIQCGVCWTFCPEGCIYRHAEGHYAADLDYCKGCGICAAECHTGCIEMKE